jgi:hypothetical protein
MARQVSCGTTRPGQRRAAVSPINRISAWFAVVFMIAWISGSLSMLLMCWHTRSRSSVAVPCAGRVRVHHLQRLVRWLAGAHDKHEHEAEPHGTILGHETQISSDYVT